MIPPAKFKSIFSQYINLLQYHRFPLCSGQAIYQNSLSFFYVEKQIFSVYIKGIMKFTDIPENLIPYFTFENLAGAGFTVNAFTTKLFHAHSDCPGQTFQPLLRKESDPEYVSFCTQALLKQFAADKDRLVPSAQKHNTNIISFYKKKL